MLNVAAEGGEARLSIPRTYAGLSNGIRSTSLRMARCAAVSLRISQNCKLTHAHFDVSGRFLLWPVQAHRAKKNRKPNEKQKGKKGT